MARTAENVRRHELIGLDMEVTELAMRYRKNIWDFVEVGIDIPLISFNAGFMDGFINSYHDAFGFSDYGRSSRPDNKFLYEVRRNGVLVLKGQSGRIRVGDIKLTLKKTLFKTNPSVSIKADIELPSGDAKHGYGNGSIDTGLALLIDTSFSKRVKAYTNIGVVFAGDLKAEETVRLRDYIYGGAAVEALVWEKISLVGQVFIQGSPFPETDISAVDRTAVLLSLGGRYRSGKNAFEFAFTEDPNSSGAPDFSFHFSWKRRLD
jgi:hypothetical protein